MIIRKKKLLMIKTEAAEFRITEHAIHDIIQRSINRVIGLERVSAQIGQDETGLEIAVTCRLKKTEDLFRASAKIKDVIKQDIEQYLGTMVKEVKVQITS